MATLVCPGSSLADLSPDLLAILDDVATAFRAASPTSDLLSGETDVVVEVTVRVRTPTGRPTDRFKSKRVRRRARDRVRHDPEAIDALIEGGWLVRWTPPGWELPGLGPWTPDDPDGADCVTLSPWAAERLGVAIVEVGSCRRAKWGKAPHLVDDLDGEFAPSVLPSWGDLPELPRVEEEDGFYVFGRRPICDPATLARIADPHGDEAGEGEDGAGGFVSQLSPLKWSLPTGGDGLLGGLGGRQPR